MRDDQDKTCSINHKKGVCAAEFFRHQAECGGQSTMQLPSAQNSVQQQQKHLGPSRQYWRDIILGVNDGLVSTFLLVTGVAGGGMRSRDILLTAIAGALAGAVSMAAGEYIATKSQNEVMKVWYMLFILCIVRKGKGFLFWQLALIELQGKRMIFCI